MSLDFFETRPRVINTRICRIFVFAVKFPSSHINVIILIRIMIIIMKKEIIVIMIMDIFIIKIIIINNDNNTGHQVWDFLKVGLEKIPYPHPSMEYRL